MRKQKSYIDTTGSFQWIQNGEMAFDEEILMQQKIMLSWLTVLVFKFIENGAIKPDNLV